jgi:hypothetical protein
MPSIRDMIYRRKVKGLRDFDYADPIQVYDAETHELLRIETPVPFNILISDPKNRRMRNIRLSNRSEEVLF